MYQSPSSDFQFSKKIKFTRNDPSSPRTFDQSSCFEPQKKFTGYGPSSPRTLDLSSCFESQKKKGKTNLEDYTDRSSGSESQKKNEKTNLDESEKKEEKTETIKITSYEHFWSMFGNTKFKYPELDELPTDVLLGIHAGMCRSMSLRRLKEKYLKDKDSGFKTKKEGYYRVLFNVDKIASHFLKPDGKVDLDKLTGLIPKEDVEWQSEEEGRGRCGYGLTVEENVEKDFENGVFEEDCEEDGDNEEDGDYDEDVDHEEDCD